MLVGGSVIQLLHEAELAIAADERRLECRGGGHASPSPTTRTARQSCIGSAFPLSS